MMTSAKDSALPISSLTIGPGSEITMSLRFDNADSLTTFSGRMSLLGSTAEELIDVSAMIRYVGPNAPERTFLRRSRSSRPERLILAFENEESSRNKARKVRTITWEGDDEYWRECAAKCARLSIQGAPGWHDMIIRNSEHELEIRFDSSP